MPKSESKPFGNIGQIPIPPPRRKLLVLGAFPDGDNLSRFVSGDLAERLAAAGWGIQVASRRHGRLGRFAELVWVPWAARRRFEVALVDVFSGPAFSWAEAAAFMLTRLHKPFVLTLHGGNLPVFANLWPRRVERLLKSAQVVTTPSRYLQQKLSKFRPDLRLLPNPIDLQAYSFRLRASPQPRLVWLRAFHEMYNPRLAPRTVAELLPDFPSVHLTMIGPDKGDGSLQRVQSEVRRLRIEDRVSLQGPVPKAQVPQALDAGDVFLNTTNVDNTPISVIEAMAMGSCVVSTNVGGIPYLLNDSQDALLVSPDSPRAMAVAVSRILRDPGLAQRVSRNARIKAEQFDWSVILPRWETLLEQLCASTHP